MREEMARHKAPSGPLDVKLGPGGLVDLEFAVHTLQLIHRTAFSPRLEEAIAMLADQGLLDDEADSDLRLLSRILVVSRLVTPIQAIEYICAFAMSARTTPEERANITNFGKALIAFHTPPKEEVERMTALAKAHSPHKNGNGKKKR